MLQPSTPWGGHVSLMFGFSCTSTLVPGGASGCVDGLGGGSELIVDRILLHEVL
jgi:hypothetical protein